MLKPMSLRHYVPAVLAFACAFVLADASLASAVTSAPAAPAAPGAPTSDSTQTTPPGRSPMTMVCTSEREGIPGSAARPAHSRASTPVERAPPWVVTS